MKDLLQNILASYLHSPLSYSLGFVVLGLFTHRVLSWLFPARNSESQISAGNNENGPLRDMVLPSRCLKWRVFNFRGKWHTSVSAIVDPPTFHDWKPVLVLANRKSGSNQGSNILKQCSMLLNQVQVHDLSSKPAAATLELCELLPQTTFIVLVCGGDGSVNWVLTTIDELNLTTQPLVSVLPLGTGNDLSNMLGYGASFDESDTMENFLSQLRHTHPINIDRWKINIRYKKTYLGWGRQTKSIFMTNYFSIGCDALISLNFHNQRQKKPSLFTKRSLNKLFYFGYGAIDVLEQHCKDLNKYIELWLDDEKVDLPDLEGILFLNISSWGGGCQIWDNWSDGDVQWDKSIPDDGRIEVMGLISSFHMAQIQVNLAEPVRLGQVKKASIIIKTRVPAQADGEPWEQDPCRIDINFHKQATLLKREAAKNDEEDGEVLQLETG
ncbi:diacylglycerol kinase epsilon-like [Styela clava]|uniref:diacylglycerol kinase epsilon-like n=1 Tax=Styela clava TaxID=7725 RepID=UPI00193A4159|nr:diacylglycerol kinase epsilon-like [Styela clava]